MRLAVVGSRDFLRLDWVDRELDRLAPNIEGIVSGGARGVDRAAEEWAADHAVPVMSFRPHKRTETMWCIGRHIRHGDGDWADVILPETYRTFAAAAFVRNGYIVEAADQVLAFWDGESSGTSHTVNRARADDKLLRVIRG